MNGPNEDQIELVVAGAAYRTRATAKFRNRKPVVPSDPKRIIAHLPGAITEVLVSPGQEVRRGEGVLVFEAMKMRNTVTATADGTVAAVRVEPGPLVAKGDLLVEIA